MGAARKTKNGTTPPAKVVHHNEKRNADSVRKTARDASLSGVTQLCSYRQNSTRLLGCHVENCRSPKRF